jgi:hypothetical protein
VGNKLPTLPAKIIRHDNSADINPTNNSTKIGIYRLHNRLLITICPALLASCAIHLVELKRESIDWSLFEKLHQAPPQHHKRCSASGTFSEAGTKHIKGLNEKNPIATEKFEALFTLHRNYPPLQTITEPTNKKTPYARNTLYIEFNEYKGILVFAHLKEEGRFVGNLLDASNGDFNCVNGVFYLVDIHDRYGAEGVNHSKNIITAFTLSEDGDLLVYNAQSPARSRTGEKIDKTESYYLFKKITARGREK